MVFQKIILPSFPRGFHLITNYIKKLPPMTHSNIFIKHTSASLTINENAILQSRIDFETHFNFMVPESADHFLHTLEGSDDMTSHIKNSLLGNSVDIPIKNGNLYLEPGREFICANIEIMEDQANSYNCKW